MKTKEKMASLKKADIQLSKYCELLKNRLDSATTQEKREILEMLAIKITATVESINIEGIIPLETIPSQTDLASVDPTHHFTNMGITVPLLV